ncbi:MAG TPA: PilZ domain-containing protein [Bryobacteraceae bacterium]|nr:PilZ domain-containing protein [Bryobacteraceae bacterium]
MNREKGIVENGIGESAAAARPADGEPRNTRPVRHSAASLQAVAIGEDKRREPRRPAQGAVHIRRADAALPEIAGRLIDISASGFRAAHTCTTLASGEVVSFSRAYAEGKARVVWTRVLSAGRNPSVESGFVVLADL